MQMQTQPMPRCYFCNEFGHPFTDCTSYRHCVKQDPNNKYMCVKCYTGHHNARNCRMPTGIYWVTPCLHAKSLTAAIMEERIQEEEEGQSDKGNLTS